MARPWLTGMILTISPGSSVVDGLKQTQDGVLPDSVYPGSGMRIGGSAIRVACRDQGTVWV